MPDPVKPVNELEAVKAELNELKTAKAQAEQDEAEAIERVKMSFGALNMEQARQCVKYQREWEKHPNHPDNVAKASAKAAKQ